MLKINQKAFKKEEGSNDQNFNCMMFEFKI